MTNREVSNQQKEVIAEFQGMPGFFVGDPLIRALNAPRALYIANLLHVYLCALNAGKLDDEGMFPYLIPDQKEDTGLPLHAVRRAKKYFTRCGVITTKFKGIPAKEYYLINLSALRALIRWGCAQGTVLPEFDLPPIITGAEKRCPIATN